MYNKVRLYDKGWSETYHGSQCIKTSLGNEFVINQLKGGRFQIFIDGEQVAGVCAKSIEIEGCLLEYTPTVDMAGRGWLTPEGGKIELNLSKRYFTINDSEDIWISTHGGIIDNLISIIHDRRFKIKEKYYDVYFSSEINPVYVICVLLVAKFEFPT